MIFITAEYLRNNPNHIFVFGDNLVRRGYGGAAKLRDFPNTFGFITKKRPDNKTTSFFTPHEYHSVFTDELLKLKSEIVSNPDKLYLISKLGSGLANKFGIFEKIISNKIQSELSKFENVKFLWE